MRQRVLQITMCMLVASTVACGCTVVDEGEIGVQTVFGKLEEQPVTPGFHFIRPWSDVDHYSIRSVDVFERAAVPTKEGLTVGMEVSIRYHVDANSATQIYATLGNPDAYHNNFLVPTIRNAIRDAVVGYNAEALYTTEREAVAEDIHGDIAPAFEERGFVLERVLIRDLDLPKTLSAAITQKLKMEQEALQMEFVLLREEQEAERKRVEAAGIADANRTIATGLTSNYLIWYQIEMLKSLATSKNNTFVITPQDQSLVPLLNVR